MVNYLAAGTSLNSFYEAFKVQTPKGCFPYEWFDSLEKLNYKGLPPQSDFYSTLSDKTIRIKFVRMNDTNKKLQLL